MLIGALLAEPALPAASDAAVLGPRLKLALHRALEATSEGAAKPAGQQPIHVVLRADPDRLQAAVDACGGSVRTVIDDIATTLVPPEGLVRLARRDGVSRIELAGRSFPHPGRFKPLQQPGTLRILQSRPSSFSAEEPPPELPDVATLHEGRPPLDRAWTGKGVVVGFFDSGINFHHLDFRDPDDPGKSRILSIWVPVGRDELSGRIRDAEWTREQIEAALKGGPDQPPEDGGHGTHVAGTAAGNGAGTGSHAGMAPEADIIMVQVGLGVSYLEAADYIYRKAGERDMPAVVSQSSWSDFGGLFFPTLEEEGLEKLVREAPGRAYVAGAGNGGEFLGHWGGFPLQRDSLWTFYKPVSLDSSLVDSFFLALNLDDRLILEGVVLGPEMEESSLALALDTERSEGEPLDGAQLARTAWYSLSDLTTDPGDWDLFTALGDLDIDWEFAVSDTLISAGGDTLGNVSLAASPLEAGGPGVRFLLEAEKFPGASDRSVLWRLMARGQGTIHVWSRLGEEGLIRRDLDAATGYRPADNYYMIISPGTSGEMIAVGAYANMELFPGVEQGELLAFSSRGPAIDGRIKPDLVAPGITYSTSHVGIDGRAVAAGTSLSAPVVAGAVALYLEKHPTATSREIREVLFASARRDRFTRSFGELPNPHWGHGKLDIIAALTGQRTFVSAAETSAPPTRGVQLHPNFPNPFNAGTTLGFALPAGGEVTLAVYNLLGQRVGLLLDRHYLPAGQHTYRYHGAGLGSGTYLLALQSGDARTARRMTLAK